MCACTAQAALINATSGWVELLVAQLLHLYPNLKPQVIHKKPPGCGLLPCSPAPSIRRFLTGYRLTVVARFSALTVATALRLKTELKQLAKRCLDLKPGTEAAFLHPLHILHPVLVVRRAAPPDPARCSGRL